MKKSLAEGVQPGINGNLLNTISNIPGTKINSMRGEPVTGYQLPHWFVDRHGTKRIEGYAVVPFIWLAAGSKAPCLYLPGPGDSGEGGTYYLNADEMLVKGQCRLTNQLLIKFESHMENKNY